ncbi:transmembrane protein, putative (macronuclear) [Tetrahymena thermophila SB210]|uniref:Transmembrane protein, putative n=1 Tax=Tetrahymena thermophila (strain SB210) TaxID=312017 RepID=Q22T98_TETTS|nr:transmembrane protein, putative [Tetrahymena thermophila SB210]EAR88540.1 transmembrane protein, putative [Tetrahymena thermophila SB210]|eukprot:XP_001008785.1 transmembrane protein, putative [Tetrahymena thermophila SB210]
MKQLDLFGSQILFRFNREPAHYTRFGSIFTIAIVSIVALRLILIISSVVQRTNPVVIYQERQVDSPKLFTINQNTFQMAFGMQDSNFNQFIDEQVYNITVTNVHKTTMVDPTTGKPTDNYITTQVPITRCSLANFPDQDNLHYYQQIDYTNMYCFPLNFDLQIEGDFNAETFQFININIQKCSQNCKPDDYIQNKLGYSFFSMQFSDIIVDPTQKTNPFKHYSRDTFFSTSLQMPKEVDFYMRNNYVQSDYGWITSDIETVNFPSFSYAEQNVYPSSFQDFFFQLVFRFEKQKENLYTRKYQNLNDIISQIGGFTQSLLAIGFIICSRLSQLDLNKEIINEAFNYENVNFEEEKVFKMYKLNGQNEMAACVQQNISPPISQDVSFDNMQQSQLKKKFENNQQNQNQKHQIKQLFKQDQPCINQSDNKGNLIKPISIDPNQSYSNNNNQSISFNGNINQSHQQSFINQTIQCNTNQNLGTKRSSFRNNIKPEIQLHACEEKKGLEDMLSSKQQISVNPQQQDENEKQFLSYLIQNKNSTVKSNGHQEEYNFHLSSDHYKLKQQQQKLEEKEQKLKESVFKRLMQKATSSMTLNTLEYLKFFLWPFGQKIQQKKKVIDYSIDQLYYHLDVLYVIKKLMEVDKLKNILLNPDQLKLFEYIPKPTIRSNYGFCKKAEDIQFEIDDHYQDNRTELQKAQQAYQAYQNIANKENLSALDIKIIQLLDQKLLSLFGFSQNQRDSLIQNIQLIPQNIEVSQSLDPTSVLKNVKDKIQIQSISVSNSNSDDDKNEKIQDISNSKLKNQPAPNTKEEHQYIFSPKSENQQMLTIAKDNHILSPRLDTEKSMYSDIAGNEAELKQSEIHKFENSNPKGQSQLNQ